MFNKKDYERLSESLETSSEILYAIEQIAGDDFYYEPHAEYEELSDNAAFYFWQEGEREDEIVAALPTTANGGSPLEEGTEVFWGIEPLFAEFDGEKWIKAC